MKCRFCSATVNDMFVDLGMQPLSNSYVSLDRSGAMEPFFPLAVRVCASCLLVQLPELESPENIFTDYAYLSSMSASWLAHCDRYAGKMVDALRLTAADRVIEIASNDGGLLRAFVSRGIPVLGIEPAQNVAEIARKVGVPTLSKFFGSAVAKEVRSEGVAPRLVAGNNVLAHVPDINDFVVGLQILLADDGVLTMEFPHLLRLIEQNQFDTIYHEHFSYLSGFVVQKVFAAHGLRLFDVEELPTHGGSLRVYACQEKHARATTPAVAALLEAERAAGLMEMRGYTTFAERVNETKRKLLSFLIEAKRAGKRVVGYGAAAKGNTLLNYCGVREDFIDFVVDRSELKQGKLLPGTHIPIRAPEAIREARPDYVLILPWNIEKEIVEANAYIREWGGKFVVPIPEVRVV